MLKILALFFLFHFHFVNNPIHPSLVSDTTGCGIYPNTIYNICITSRLLRLYSQGLIELHYTLFSNLNHIAQMTARA